MSRTVSSYLGFDWGRLRMGVASGNSLTRSAQSVATLTEQGAARQQVIVRLVREWRPAALVVGVPCHPDGAPHKNTRLAKEFAKELRAWTGLTVHEVDERYSTTEAKGDNPKAKENQLDALSACIILEQYLRSLPQ
ncbi:MAG: Holliday junction resolvase RuvX [Cytophagales bacterium]|nr:Holliday junction resolvase RuvX [Cytophagales bacterium]